MFKLFKKKENLIECNYNKVVGWYYKTYISPYRNCTDSVSVYERRMCECGKYKDTLISEQEFLPTMYTVGNKDKIDYIESLGRKGIMYKLSFEIQQSKLKEVATK